MFLEKFTSKAKCAFACVLVFLIAAASLPVAVIAQDEDTTITIVHTNDFHGYYKATSRGQIGFSALKEVIDENGADLVLDAGDTFHGQAFATVEQGESMAELMDAVGYDAMTPGNHDWSYSAEKLKELDSDYNFNILAANVKAKDGSDYFENPYLVKDVVADDGTQLKVGVVGVIDDSFYSSTASENVANVEFAEDAAVATETAEKLKSDENCDIVIAITHQRSPEDFVSRVSGIDAVIAGHEHIVYEKTVADKTGKNIPVVEAGYYFNNIGVLSLTYDSATGEIESANETTLSSADTAELANAEIDAKIAEIEARENVVLDEVISTGSADYPYSWEDVRISEQAIGRIVTASYLDLTGADVAMENAGGIRGGISSGNITYKDLIGISPYGNVLVVKELTGLQILDIAECSLEISRACDEVYTLQKKALAEGKDPYEYSWPQNSGSALQFGGITFEYDLSQPVGSRIIGAKIGGQTLYKSVTYKVATNNYVSESTGYPAISSVPLLSEYGTCEEALRKYIVKGTFENAAATPNLVNITPPTVEPTTESVTSTEKLLPTTKMPTTISAKKITLKKPVVKLKAGKKRITVSFKKINNAKKYTIQYRVKGNKKWKTKTTTKTKFVLKKLKSGKRYQIRVRAVTTQSGNNIYGSYSKIKTVKVKK